MATRAGPIDLLTAQVSHKSRRHVEVTAFEKVEEPDRVNGLTETRRQGNEDTITFRQQTHVIVRMTSDASTRARQKRDESKSDYFNLGNVANGVVAEINGRSLQRVLFVVLIYDRRRNAQMTRRLPR